MSVLLVTTSWTNVYENSSLLERAENEHGVRCKYVCHEDTLCLTRGVYLFSPRNSCCSSDIRL